MSLLLLLKSGGATVHERAADAGATSTATVAAIREHVRQVASSATGDAAVASQRDLLRAVDAAATSGTSVAAIREHIRAATSSATGSATVAGQRDLLRSASASGVGTAEVSGVIGGQTFERAVDASSTGAATVGVLAVRVRSVAADASGAAAVSAIRVHVRAVSSSASSGASVASMREHVRAPSSSATGTAVVLVQRDLLRAASASGTVTATVAGRVNTVLVRAVAAESSGSATVAWFKFRPPPKLATHKVPPRTVTRSKRYAPRIRRVR